VEALSVRSFAPMSFLKVEHKESGTYLRILESYRNDAGNPTSRVLYSLGKVEDYTPEQLRSIGIRLYELGGGEVKALLEGKVEEKARYNYGYAQVYGKVMKHYELDVLLNRVRRKHKIQFDLYNAVLLMLFERLHDPCSKRSNYCNQLDYAGIEAVYLQYLYRSLDKLADYSAPIQKQIFQTGRDLFNQQLDVVFYDVTTLYFESEVEEEGSLRQKGFSKDGKIGNTQILFCMMIDRHKQPVGYRIFKGDTFEGHTFEKALDDLKQEFNIDKVIVVADRGMLSKNNIELTTSKGYEFILGERLKSLPAAIQKDLLDRSTYQHEWIYKDQDDEQVRIQYKMIEHEGKTIIVTYSAKRAAKDKHDREEKLIIAGQLLRQPSLIKKKAARYFLKQKGEEEYSLDEEKVKKQEKYDGILAITTNTTTLSATEILENYKQLYKIEHTFRSFKGHLEMRPMFHWTDKRIEGHICLCYIAYTLLNYVLQKANQKKIILTEAILRKQLDHMQVSLLQHNDNEVYLRSMPGQGEAQLQHLLGLRQLPPILPATRLSSFI
jgi:transposase